MTSTSIAGQVHEPQTLTMPRRNRLEWWAGLAGIVFALGVIAQGVLRHAFEPSGDVSAEVLRGYFVEHVWVVGVLDAAVAINTVFLMLFVASVYHRTVGKSGIWARLGLLGAAGVLAYFPLTMAIETTMTVGAKLSDNALLLLWELDSAVFIRAVLTVGAALLGLSLASVRAGLVPRVFVWIGPLCGALMVVTGAAAVPVAHGSPLVQLGMVGFLGWLAFLVAAGIGLMRRT